MVLKGVMELIWQVEGVLRFIGWRFCFEDGHYSPLFLARSGDLYVVESASSVERSP
ncbi:MAG: hypothetical protein ABIK68_19720 [bacterium]